MTLDSCPIIGTTAYQAEECDVVPLDIVITRDGPKKVGTRVEHGVHRLTRPRRLSPNPPRRVVGGVPWTRRCPLSGNDVSCDGQHRGAGEGI